MSRKNDSLSCTAILPVELSENDVDELVKVAKQLSVKEALEVSRKNSSVRDQGNSYHLYGVLPDGNRFSERLHPTRNDIDRFGRPNRKKKGSLKPKKWLK